MTEHDWLAIPEDKLPTALAMVLRKKPWKHVVNSRFSDDRWSCRRCKKIGTYEELDNEFCSVPDPIKIDWNTAMEWRDSTEAGNFLKYLSIVCIAAFGGKRHDWANWGDMYYFVTHKTQPKHYLIAAALAAERKEE